MPVRGSHVSDACAPVSINARLASRGFGGNSGAVKDVLGRPPRQTRVRISNGQRRVRPLRFVNEAARPVGDTEGQVTVGAFNPPSTSYLMSILTNRFIPGLVWHNFWHLPLQPCVARAGCCGHAPVRGACAILSAKWPE